MNDDKLSMLKIMMYVFLFRARKTKINGPGIDQYTNLGFSYQVLMAISSGPRLIKKQEMAKPFIVYFIRDTFIGYVRRNRRFVFLEPASPASAVKPVLSTDGAFLVQVQSYQRLLYKFKQILLKKVQARIYLTWIIQLVTLELRFCLRDGECWVKRGLNRGTLLAWCLAYYGHLKLFCHRPMEIGFSFLSLLFFSRACRLKKDTVKKHSESDIFAS